MGGKGGREVRGRLLRRRAAFEEKLGGSALRAHPVVGGHLLVDGSPDDRVHEFERVLLAEQVRANERSCCAQGGRRIEAGEGGRKPKLGPVTEDHGGVQKRAGRLGQA